MSQDCQTGAVLSGRSKALSKTQIIVCSTCGYSDRDERGRTRGERLRCDLAEKVGSQPGAVEVTATKCLMACDKGCNVLVRSPNKVGYVLSHLEPSEESMELLLSYVAEYNATDDGVVAYKRWPDGIGEKFLCRIPPTPTD